MQKVPKNYYNENFKYMKKFLNINLTNICKKLNLNRTSISAGNGTDEQYKLIKEEIESSIAKLYLKGKINE
jgi:hypothetical protein